MKVYHVILKHGSFPVGVVTVHNKVIKAHPSLGRIRGKSIKEVKKLVREKKGSIKKVYPSSIKRGASWNS